MSKTAAQHLQENPTHNCRYEVTEVWGTMTDRLNVGDVIVDSDHGEEHDWSIYNLDTMTPVGGWTGKYIGKVVAE